MICYLDTSVLLQYLLKGDQGYKKVLDFEHVVSSELLIVECNRVIDRCNLVGELTNEQLPNIREGLNRIVDGISLLRLNQSVKRRACEPFPTVISTLDAIHVSTALLWQEIEGPVTIFSYDRQMNTCAEALNMHILE